MKSSDSKNTDAPEINTLKRQATFDANENSFGEPRSPRRAPSPTPSIMDLDIPDIDDSLNELSMNFDQFSNDDINEKLVSAVMEAHQILDSVVSKMRLIELKKKPVSSSVLSLIGK